MPTKRKKSSKDDDIAFPKVLTEEEKDFKDNVTFERLRKAETTSNTLSFIVLYLMLDQKVQRKMQAEIDSLNEDGELLKRITMAHRTKLPYTQAVIQEGQRLCNLIPLNLPHRTTRDVEINGHQIAKGMRIVPQISTVLGDERIFPNARRFIPECFLDENGQLKKCEEFVPFSVGKRQCLGESLARMELFLFTANLFNAYKINSQLNITSN